MYISQYKVDDTPLGEGGMGRIYKATTPEGKVVAIKEILPEFAQDVEMRFRINQERTILDRLENPSIVHTYESFMNKDKYYIVMDLVEGRNIEQQIQIQQKPFSVDVAIDIMLRVLEVMQYVHGEGVVHRDIKPSNIMIRPDGSVCMLDFGIAKDLNANSSHTVIGSVIGSEGYMSPEQASGYTIDHRSDIYALGCVLYFMLTGHHAFPTCQSQALMLDAVLNQPFPKLDKYLKNVKPELQQVLDKATDKNMVRRFQSCAIFANALRSLKGEVVEQNEDRSTIRIRPDQGCSISVGRLDPNNPGACDIEINDPTNRVSRHHADIELKSFTGGTFFIYHDISSNGTLINGNSVHRMAYHVEQDAEDPVIFLASDANCRLDWAKVKQMLFDKAKEVPPTPPAPPPTPAPASPVPAPASPVPNPWGSVEQPIQPATPEKNKIVLFSVSIFFIVMGVILSIVAFFQPLESLSIMLGAGIAFLSIGVLTLVFRSLKI